MEWYKWRFYCEWVAKQNFGCKNLKLCNKKKGHVFEEIKYSLLKLIKQVKKNCKKKKYQHKK